MTINRYARFMVLFVLIFALPTSITLASSPDGNTSNADHATVARRAAVYGDSAAVIVELRTRCPAGEYGNIRLIARSHNEAVGQGFADVACVGRMTSTKAAIFGIVPLDFRTFRVRTTIRSCAEECSVTSKRVVKLVNNSPSAPGFDGEHLRYHLNRRATAQEDGSATARASSVCRAMDGRLDAILVQRQADSVVTAIADHSLACDGRDLIDFTFMADDPFVRGRAFLAVLGQVCIDFTTCRFGIAYRELDLRESA